MDSDATDEQLDQAIGEWFLRTEEDPNILPGQFAATLAASLREPFLRELEALAAIDGLATGSAPRGLPVRFGDYRVLSELGRGAMGTVYAAECVSTAQSVALKVMHAHVANDRTSAARFQREARTASSLKHPGIVSVLAVGSEQGQQWLAMVRICGHSLQRLLQAAKQPQDIDHDLALATLNDHELLARMFAGAADALAFAHGQNVVHRDIKPANLMCSDSHHIVILDFGLATALDDESLDLTRSGDLLGTPLYMAPEQVVGAQNGTTASDIYSLGAVIYECLCLRAPVAPGPLAQVLDAIRNRDPVDPRRLRAGVPAALARIAMQCLEKDPRRRYIDAASLAADLRRFVAGTSVHARKLRVLDLVARRIRRRPVVAGLLAVVLLMVPVLYATVRLADRRQVTVSELQRANDLRRTRQLLALSPEGCTVAGGASRRFYERLGLGSYLPESESARSAGASQALQLAEHLADTFRGDVEVLRNLARVLFDVGDEDARMQVVLDELLAHPDVAASDRALAAVWYQQQGRFEQADRLFVSVDASAPGVAFWLGIWHQHRQDYFAAIRAFDRALAEPGLAEELRYFAHLHRGWCQTCPQVCRIRAAEDDLLQAAALRPNYGTARLLWAAVRCLDPEDDLSRPVAAVGEILTAVDMEPWVVVLTARVLLAFAEGSTWQAGPVRFAADFSPISVAPLPPGRAVALASKGLELLDAIQTKHPALFESRFHRIAALTLVGRHGDALAACEQLLTNSSPAMRTAVLLQRARVHLALGHAEVARRDVAEVLALDAGFVAGWRFLAELEAHVGDARSELQALGHAVNAWQGLHAEPSVFADGAAVLPDMQLRRIRLHLWLGERAAARELLQHGAFGGVLGGDSNHRVALQRASLLMSLGVDDDRSQAEAVAQIPLDSPLRLLLRNRSSSEQPSSAAFAASLQRAWIEAATLPETAFNGDNVWAAATAGVVVMQGGMGAVDAMQRAGARSLTVGMPMSPDTLLGAVTRGEALPNTTGLVGATGPMPIGALMPHLPTLVEDQGIADRLRGLAEMELARDPDNGEVRLLLAVVHVCRQDAARASELLATTLDAHPHDVRARYVLAVAALAVRDADLLRRALLHRGQLLDAPAIEAARIALRVPLAVGAGELLLALR